MGKMKEIQPIKFNPIKNIKEAPGTQIAGTFKGGREVIHDDGSKSMIYTVETADGVFDFWGTSRLDGLLCQVKPGQEIEITYNGMKKEDVKFKGNTRQMDVHSFTVKAA